MSTIITTMGRTLAARVETRSAARLSALWALRRAVRLREVTVWAGAYGSVTIGPGPEGGVWVVTEAVGATERALLDAGECLDSLALVVGLLAAGCWGRFAAVRFL